MTTFNTKLSEEERGIKGVRLKIILKVLFDTADVNSYAEFWLFGMRKSGFD
ncbi:MAG: hypothetical protein HYY41_03825 [Chloroflexi bacterium]|nr:hypothetical protein [Chloroflexota bacterium]